MKTVTAALFALTALSATGSIIDGDEQDPRIAKRGPIIEKVNVVQHNFFEDSERCKYCRG